MASLSLFPLSLFPLSLSSLWCVCVLGVAWPGLALPVLLYSGLGGFSPLSLLSSLSSPPCSPLSLVWGPLLSRPTSSFSCWGFVAFWGLCWLCLFPLSLFPLSLFPLSLSSLWCVCVLAATQLTRPFADTQHLCGFFRTRCAERLCFVLYLRAPFLGTSSPVWSKRPAHGDDRLSGRYPRSCCF